MRAYSQLLDQLAKLVRDKHYSLFRVAVSDEESFIELSGLIFFLKQILFCFLKFEYDQPLRGGCCLSKKVLFQPSFLLIKYYSDLNMYVYYIHMFVCVCVCLCVSVCATIIYMAVTYVLKICLLTTFSVTGQQASRLVGQQASRLVGQQASKLVGSQVNKLVKLVGQLASTSIVSYQASKLVGQ